ncbi:hypothetical protein BH11ARM2_BH11ARM2_35160 [soil metagenome]
MRYPDGVLASVALSGLLLLGRQSTEAVFKAASPAVVRVRQVQYKEVSTGTVFAVLGGWLWSPATTWFPAS